MPNKEHEGFTVYGLGDVTRSGDLIEVTLQLTYTWHDLVDVNEGYKTDRWKSAFARDAVPNASDYELTITWTDTVSVTIDAASAEVFLSKKGWPFESTPAPPMVTFDFDQALNLQIHLPNKTPTETE